jgi:hypothetical protein
VKGSLLEQQLSSPAPLDCRYAERVPIDYRVTYTGAGGTRLIKTEGSLRDQSKTECKILGMSLPAARCSSAPTIYFEDGQTPLSLTDATVSRIKGNIFAGWFPNLTPDKRKRAQELIWKHVTLSPSKQPRAAFLIV